MLASTTTDESLWPLLISRFEGRATDADFETWLTRGSALLQRRERHVVVIDLTRIEVPTAAQRWRQAEWLEAHAELMREWQLGCALVITSPFLRMTLSVIHHVRPIPVPYVVVSDVAAGVEWGLAQLEEAGMQVQAERIRRRLGRRSHGNAG
jgi:hypothetical protein